ncbi:flagellar biosynthesis protein [Rhodanobacter glycinis]|uniref:Flagellar biosynthesis protein n=1 Tax=Rhodanobacter glycinis TaxID=582702 RepID=A0A5B9E5U5_9GAMM|nr:flagellar biosynthesis protein [Rhodanobacter glycinis]QEE26020.1 flagellar biosynthesis protein [Rhodanobacter glycinis]
MSRKSVGLLAVCLSVSLVGCATSRSEIKLQAPTVAPSPAASAKTGRVVVIKSVVDERVFEQAPPDPSTPSLGFGGSDTATAQVKSQAIGRKRNGFGKALGDVLLQQGQTVQDVVRKNLALALQQSGYQVKTQDDAGTNPVVLDVHIKKFWSWFQPGFWAITLHSDIATTLQVEGQGAPIEIEVHAEDKRQMATDKAWMEITQQGLDAYRAKVVQGVAGKF